MCHASTGRFSNASAIQIDLSACGEVLLDVEQRIWLQPGGTPDSLRFTVVVAMIPLIFAGAGLLKGFAITTIIGITIGVFVTRPAYSSFVEIMLK